MATLGLLGCGSVDQTASTSAEILPPSGTPLLAAPSSIAPARPVDLELPTSTATTLPPADVVTVAIAKKELRVVPPRGGATETILTFESVSALGPDGFDETQKRSGKNDFYISPLARSLDLLKPADDSVGTIAIMADATTPYRALFEVFYTAGQNNFGVFHLLVRTKRGPASLRFTPPRVGGSQMPNAEALNLAAVIGADGIKLKSSFGNIAPGCETDPAVVAGPGVAVPNQSGSFDIATLVACVRNVKRANDGKYKDETNVTVAAERTIEFQHVVAIVDALRGDAGELFPEVTFAVSK